MKMKRVAMKQSEGLEEAKLATLGGAPQYKQHSNSSVAIWAFL